MTIFDLTSEFKDALPFLSDNENNESNRAEEMSNPNRQSDAENIAHARGNTSTFAERLAAGSPHTGLYGYVGTEPHSSAKAAQYQILRLFTQTFNPDIIPYDERPLVAMHWVHSLKRHLSALNEVPAAQMLVFIYTLLQGSADIASFKLTQRNDVTVELFFEWFESRYCQSSYGISILDELQSLKQTGSLQEYVASATQLQAYNDFTPAPVTNRVMKEYFIRGLQNTALQRQLRMIRFTPAEIENGDDVTETMREAERLVREGVYSEFVNAKSNAPANQSSGNARANGHNKGFQNPVVNRPWNLYQGSQGPTFLPPPFRMNGYQAGYFRQPGQNVTQLQRPNQQGTYQPPHVRSQQQQSHQANRPQPNPFAPKNAQHNYDPFGNQRSAPPDPDAMQLDAISFGNSFGQFYAPPEQYEAPTAYMNAPHGRWVYYEDPSQPEVQPEYNDQSESANHQYEAETPKVEGQR